MLELNLFFCLDVHFVLDRFWSAELDFEIELAPGLFKASNLLFYHGGTNCLYGYHSRALF